ncbi:MAG: RDD family protein [Anaerolineae bacterium]|nr:RDD family protein [Anaerolineae bacterium]
MNKPFQPGQYAGFVSRFIAFTIDMVIISLISFLFTVFVGLISNFFGLDTSYVDLVGEWFVTGLQQLLVTAGAMFTGVFSLAYCLFFWVLIGATPGKRLMGLRIVRLNGQPLTVGLALLRYLGYWLSFLLLCLGYVWIIIDPRRQGWHDKLGRTVVIYDR